MNRSLAALNRAFEKAFSHSSQQQMLPELLQYLGEELACDRISIFETGDERAYRNVYEWCREGVDSEQIFLQHLTYEQLGTWQARLERDEIITVEDVESIRTAEPGLYRLLTEQGIRAVIVSALAFQGQSFGFFVMENPSEATIFGEEVILPGLRYILSSLVYSDHLLSRLERFGYSDSLTGAGNRLGLQSYLEQLDHGVSVGLVYCSVYDWATADGRPAHLQTEQMIIHTSSILQHVFGEETVYRVAQADFLVVRSGAAEAQFRQEVEIFRHLTSEQDLLVAAGSLWKEDCRESMDELIRQVSLRMYRERRMLTDQEAERQRLREARQDPWAVQDKAAISMYQGDEFFTKGDLWLSHIFDENVVMLVIDLNFFRLYNDIFGRRSGNLLLESIADSVMRLARNHGGIGGYMGNDDFCLMLPVQDKDYSTLRPRVLELIEEFQYTDGFAPVFGVYLSTNRMENCVTLYDRALAALSEIKGSYTERCQFYNAEHFRIARENKILMIDAKEGLEQGEFLFYLQPQVNEKDGRIIGAEALIRWNYRGRICTPKLFLEEMERTGFIYSLDLFIWEEVCKWLRSLLDRGIEPLPVSVNVSRVDFYFGDVAEVLISLIQKYNLEPGMLGIEITESAFTDNLDVIRSVADRLHRHGFRIYMDDFGSGSSSLSMLYQLNVDVLKTDVRFMSKVDVDEKAASIVESVISMAHMIGMMVITEGVETEEQRNSLLAMGDTYVQGYYFYRPMPVEEYERLLQDPEKVGTPPKKGGALLTSRLHFRDMMHEGILNDTLLDNIVGPAAVYSEQDGVISILQMNEAYSRLTGIDPGDHAGMERFIRRHYLTGAESVRAAFHNADHSLEGSYSEGIFWRSDGTQVTLRGKIYLLYSLGDHKLYMSTILQEQ